MLSSSVNAMEIEKEVEYSPSSYSFNAQIFTLGYVPSFVTFSPTGDLCFFRLGGMEVMESSNLEIEERETTSPYANFISSIHFGGNNHLCLLGSYTTNPVGIWKGEKETTFLVQANCEPSTSLNEKCDMCVLGSSDSSTVYKINVTTEELIVTLKGERALYLGAASPYARCWNKKIRIIDSIQQKGLMTLVGHTAGITSFSVTSDRNFLLTGSWDKTARLWNLETGELLRTFKGHTAGISCMAFSPDGQTILTGSWDATACLWNSTTGKLITTLIGHSKAVTCVAFSPDGQTILTGSRDKTARLWNVSNCEAEKGF